jgi:Stage II sporulation protein E (SpoIIE)
MAAWPRRATRRTGTGPESEGVAFSSSPGSVAGTFNRLRRDPWTFPRRPWVAAAVVLAAELAIALPFLAVSPSTARGVPGPLLVVLGVGAAATLGPWFGVGLTTAAVVLAVAIIGENPVAEPLVWLPVSIVVGLAGVHVRRGETLRRELLESLYQGVVSLASASEVEPLVVVSRYVPAERAQVLAGDFYGAIRQPSGRVAVMVGDVAGHGPSAAAVATRLRAAWRGLAGSDVPAEQAIGVLNDLLIAERNRHGTPITFATMCLVSIDAERAEASVLLAGHPPPIILGAGVAEACRIDPNPVIGVVARERWATHRVALPAPPWTMVVYTDGLVEGRSAPDGARPFGVARLVRLLAAHDPPIGEAEVDAVVAAVRQANGGPLGDDMVLLAASSHAAH